MASRELHFFHLAVWVLISWASCLNAFPLATTSSSSSLSKRELVLLSSITSSSTNNAVGGKQRYGSGNGNGAEERRQQSLDQGHHPLISLNLNLDSLAQSAAASRAQELLQRIHALYKDGYYEVSPDTVSYNSVLKAWKEEDNPEQAYELLKSMLNDDNHSSKSGAGETTIRSTIQADVISFNTVILAFARQGNYIKAQELLQQMRDQPHLPDPDTVTYNAVLYALAESPDKGGATQAENLLKEMLQPTSKVTVDTTSFNTVLHAFAQGGTRNSAQRAQLLLNHMEQLAAAGNTNVVPDVYSYTTVIQSWGKCERPVEAQAVLDSMIDHGLEPNRFTYTCIISSLAKSGEASKAEQVLDAMMLEYSQGNEDMKPDTIAFSSVMDGWAKTSCVEKPEAADRALQLLKRMEQLEAEGIGPNARTYTSILTAIAKSGTWDACTKARALLQDMEYQSQQLGKVQVTPSNIHYNVALNAYARSPRADKALKASGLFNEMEHHDNPRCQPDIISYNSLLLACSNAFGNDELRQKSYLIAVDAFKSAMNGQYNVRPTSTTFANFCRASRRLVVDPSKRLGILGKTFKLCCERGLVNKAVLLQIKTGCATRHDWETVLGSAAEFLPNEEKVNTARFPSAWTCHARR
jgi:pentatricopeptide repeat protein